MWRRVSLLALVLAVSTSMTGQSLTEVAKKEKKRREKNQQQGVKVRVIQEEEVSTDETEANTSDESADEDAVDSALPLSRGDSTAPSSPAGSDRKRQEAEWRARLSEVKSRLSDAKERFEFLSGLHLTPGEYYVDENGQPLITSLEQLRQMVSQAKADRDAAQKALDDLKEEARKAGVPPGWLR